MDRDQFDSNINYIIPILYSLSRYGMISISAETGDTRIGAINPDPRKRHVLGKRKDDGSLIWDWDWDWEHNRPTVQASGSSRGRLERSSRLQRGERQTTDSVDDDAPRRHAKANRGRAKVRIST